MDIKLYSNCINVNGFTRSVIYDLQRKEYEIIPKKLSEFIDNDNVKISQSEFKEYKQFLIEKDYIINFSEDQKVNKFPKLDLSWDYPSHITNIIIDVNNLINFENLSNLINVSLCQDIQIRVMEEGLDLELLLNKINENQIRSIELFIKYTKDIKKIARDLSEKFEKLRVIGIYAAPKFEIIKDELFYKIFLFEKELNSDAQSNAQDYFNVNIKLFTESQKHHSYFNRKLYICANGEIKNAPECNETFDLLSNLKSKKNVEKLIFNSKIKKLWFISKEKIDVCKDCEFRFMCVDNRVPHQRKKNEWYHKIECNYNPFICKWEGEEGYQSLEKIGVITNENEYSIDHEKISSINHKLWGEEE